MSMWIPHSEETLTQGGRNRRDEQVVEGALQKARSNLVDLRYASHVCNSNLSRSNAYNSAILAMHIVDVIHATARLCGNLGRAS